MVGDNLGRVPRLFLDPVDARVIDFVDGQQDLERKIVRAIGEPRERFAEDKLRMLRAVRMAATFDFALDAATLAGVQEMADQVTVVSVERIAQEIRTTLVLPARVRAAELLRESGILRAILPEVSATCEALRAVVAPRETWWDHTLRVLGALAEPSFPLAFATLLQAIAAEQPEHVIETAEAIARRWKLSNDEVERIEWLVRHQHSLQGAAAQPWPRVQRILIAPGCRELLNLHEAQAAADKLPTTDVEFCRERLAWPAVRLNPPPLVNGGDLIAQGVKPGPDFAVLLDGVRDAQLEGLLGSKAEAIEWVKSALAVGLPQSLRRNAP